MFYLLYIFYILLSKPLGESYPPYMFASGIEWSKIIGRWETVGQKIT